MGSFTPASRTAIPSSAEVTPRKTASCIFQGARAFNDAVAIGIALDDAARGDAGAEMAGDDAIIFSQGGERNFRPVGAGVHGEFLLCG